MGADPPGLLSLVAECSPMFFCDASVFWGLFPLHFELLLLLFFSRYFLCYNLSQSPSLSVGACQPCSAGTTAGIGDPPSKNETVPERQEAPAVRLAVTIWLIGTRTLIVTEICAC